MKVFEFNWFKEQEKDWVASETMIAAIKLYCSTTENDIWNWDDNDTVTEIPEDKWDVYKVIDEDKNTEITFRQWMSENNAPDMICSTAYLNKYRDID